MRTLVHQTFVQKENMIINKGLHSALYLFFGKKTEKLENTLTKNDETDIVWVSFNRWM